MTAKRELFRYKRLSIPESKNRIARLQWSSFPEFENQTFEKIFATLVSVGVEGGDWGDLETIREHPDFTEIEGLKDGKTYLFPGTVYPEDDNAYSLQWEKDGNTFTRDFESLIIPFKSSQYGIIYKLKKENLH